MSTMGYYVVLGIAEDADSHTIRSAFRALARRYHLDAGAASSTLQFRRALEAYETLSDPERRRLYDRELRGERVRATIVAESIDLTPLADPVFRSRTVSVDFPIRRVTGHEVKPPFRTCLPTCWSQWQTTDSALRSGTERPRTLLKL
jgi:curved DNA-binding protein CbpA